MGDKKKSGHIDTYVGNNYGFGGNKFNGNFNVNLPGGISAPSGSTAPPPNPPQPPSGTEIDTYVGNNYGFGGNKFDGTYDINIGGGQTSPKKPHKPDPKPHKPDPKPHKPDVKPHKPQPCQPQPCQPQTRPQPCHTAGRSTCTLPGGGMQTSCPVCEGIWARNNSMANYQALLRGDHIYS